MLIKLIDAKRDLSIQVHPDDNYAAKHEGGYGKTEMWYVVDCDKGASIYYGFKNEISKEDFRRSIEENTLTDLLKKIEVKKGDCFFIPAGTSPRNRRRNAYCGNSAELEFDLSCIRLRPSRHRRKAARVTH